MTNPFKLVAISLIPNFTFREILLSLKLILNPGNYFDQNPALKLEHELGKYLSRKHMILFESGREAEYFLLRALGIGEGDEVIVQAFTCVAVPDPVLWVGAKPVYVDVDDSLNIDPEELKKAISKNTKAVIVQHTFGVPANLEKIRPICSEQGVALIEDCAHGLGNEYNGKKLGTFGEAAFFSFGRDKVISGVWGGAVATDDGELARKIQDTRSKTQERSTWWVAQQLIYPVLVWKILNTYGFFGLGKVIHKVFQTIGLLSRVVTLGEKSGEKPEVFYRGLPGALAVLILEQLKNLDNFLEHRRKLAKYYDSQLGTGFDPKSSYLRYSVQVDDPKGLRRFAAKKNIILGDWYDMVVAPKDVNLEKVSYKLGSCPEAENICKRIINLPTNPNMDFDDAAKVVKVVKLWKLKK